MSTLRTNEIKMLDDRGSSNFTFDSVSDLQSSTQLIVGQRVRTLGYHSPGDGGGNDYEIVSAATGTDDGGSFIDLSGSGTQGRGLFLEGKYYDNQFGATDTGSDQSNIYKALIDAAPDGSRVICLKKDSILSIEGVSIENKTLSIDFSGNCVTPVTLGGRFLDVFSDPDISLEVSSVSTSSGTLFPGSSTTSLVVLDNSDFKVGDLVKVVADDFIPERHTTNRNIGEFARVREVVSTDTIILDKLLYDHDLYSTNIFIHKFPKKTLELANINFKNIIPGEPQSNSYLCVIRSMYKPRMKNISCEDYKGTLIRMVSCFQYRAENISVSNTGLGGDGEQSVKYGVDDTSCEGGVIDQIRGSFVRHTVTTNSVLSGTGSMIAGRTMNLTVKNGIGEGGSNAPFDTHPEAVNVLFENCFVKDCNSGYQSRSSGTRFVNCGFRRVITAFTVRSSPNATVNTVSRQEIINPYGESRRFLEVTGPTDLSERIGEVSVTGGDISIDISIAGPLVLFSRDNCDVSLNSMRVKISGSRHFAGLSQGSPGSELGMSNCNLFYSDETINQILFRSETYDAGNPSLLRASDVQCYGGDHRAIVRDSDVIQRNISIENYASGGTDVIQNSGSERTFDFTTN